MVSFHAAGQRRVQSSQSSRHANSHSSNPVQSSPVHSIPDTAATPRKARFLLFNVSQVLVSFFIKCFFFLLRVFIRLSNTHEKGEHERKIRFVLSSREFISSHQKKQGPKHTPNGFILLLHTRDPRTSKRCRRRRGRAPRKHLPPFPQPGSWNRPWSAQQPTACQRTQGACAPRMRGLGHASMMGEAWKQEQPLAAFVLWWARRAAACRS